MLETTSESAPLMPFQGPIGATITRGARLPVATCPRAPSLSLRAGAGAARLTPRAPANLLRPGKARPDARRLLFAPGLATLAGHVARSLAPHPSTLLALVLALREAGWSAGRLARRYGVTPRAVREWSEPGTSARPTASRTVRRIQAHARQLAGVEGYPMFQPGSMAQLLESAVKALEAQLRDQGAPGLPAGPSDVSDQAERLWPSCRGLLASKARTGALSSVRAAVMAVLSERGFTQDVIGQAVGRERSTVAYHVGR